MYSIVQRPDKSCDVYQSGLSGTLPIGTWKDLRFIPHNEYRHGIPSSLMRFLLSDEVRLGQRHLTQEMKLFLAGALEHQDDEPRCAEDVEERLKTQNGRYELTMAVVEMIHIVDDPSPGRAMAEEWIGRR